MIQLNRNCTNFLGGQINNEEKILCFNNPAVTIGGLPFSSSSSSKLDQFGRFKSSPEKTTPINYGPSPPAGRIKIISLSAGFLPALPLCRFVAESLAAQSKHYSRSGVE